MKIFVDFVNAITDYYSTKTLVMIKEHDLTSQSQSDVIEENKDKTKNSIGFQLPVVEETDVDIVKKMVKDEINKLHNNPFDVQSAQRLARLQKVLDILKNSSN